MKKLTLTLTALAFAFTATVKTSYASAKNIETTLSNIGTFNKIEVHGNVEVLFASGPKDEVKVNNDYYAENALVQDENGVLRISSYKAEKLVVYVTATDLRSITAYDNASVKSDGRLSLIDLSVDLHDNAYASLNLDNYAADISVNDHAKADLSGNVIDYNLNYSHSSTVNRTDLAALNTTETVTTPYQVEKHPHHHIMRMVDARFNS